jgi:signal-transduction protein with cAMP-binding, CBS, and nucleotidyltransferase domain
MNIEISGKVSSILAHKETFPIWSIGPNAMVFDAIQLMDGKNVGALLVVDNKTLVGIVSERDYIRKVIVKGRSCKNTPVSEIMTKQVLTVNLSNSVTECMRIMTERRVRHLPVLEGTKLVGILSIRDVVNWLMSAQTATIDNLLLDYHGSSPFEKFGRGELGLSGRLACPAAFRF